MFLPHARPLAAGTVVALAVAAAPDLRAGEPILAALRHPALAPETVTAGDVDGDGAPDLVAGLEFGRRIAVLRGRGDGGFTPPEVVVSYPSSVVPRLPRLMHLDGDEHLDLIVFPDELRLGGGDGTFGAPQPFPGVAFYSGISASLFARADFDGDGRLDFVNEARVGTPIGGTAQPGLVAYLTRPDGSLETGVVPSVVFGEPFRAVAAGDFDGDGHADVVSSSPDELRLHPGGGDGSFGPPAQVFAQDEWISSMAPGDFDGDGRLDLAALGFGLANQVTLWMGDASGALVRGATVPLAAYGTPPSFSRTTRVFAEDVDGDGHLDLLALASDVDALFFFRGAGDGTLPTRRAAELGAPSTAPSFADADASDFDADGRADLVVADLDDLALRPFLGSRTEFVELGLALPGPAGLARLRGSGSTVHQEAFGLRLSYGAAGAPGLLVVGLDTEVRPFLGGLLGPVPLATMAFMTPLVHDSRWPGLLPGTTVYFQAWLADGGAVASNVLAGVTTF